MKISRQDTAAISQPPRNGPIAVPTPAKPVQAPMALLRSSWRNDASMIARLPGVSSAAPMPCTARATISIGAFGATPQSGRRHSEPDHADQEDLLAPVLVTKPPGDTAAGRPA